MVLLAPWKRVSVSLPRLGPQRSLAAAATLGRVMGRALTPDCTFELGLVTSERQSASCFLQHCSFAATGVRSVAIWWVGGWS